MEYIIIVILLLIAILIVITYDIKLSIEHLKIKKEFIKSYDKQMKFDKM